MEGATVRVRVSLDVRRLHESLTRLFGLEYAGPRELSALLGIDVRAAGRILSLMAREGLAVKWTRRVYRLSTPHPPVARDRIRGRAEPHDDHNTVEGPGTEPPADGEAEEYCERRHYYDG
ncbi:MAG: hypothetical protein F7C34_01050 [Desulfurococcales archaeon]|nr:hypothetical protein [Desulfurococcales archaeon]